ncbi:hypothetical protein ANANG_G00008120 [Anguilla anguilla]|uniref:Uncharacterized protein n=1 Tax=Anguilla anguilla TaxID=7936 RepID=A0A9D3S6C6_ANGAN|nr:hypothetical protein ANANG_G00008120 [Anguilla anguilla]
MELSDARQHEKLDHRATKVAHN